MTGDYRKFTTVVNWAHESRREHPYDVLEGQCHRCREMMEKQRFMWEDNPFCWKCDASDAEDALA